MPPLFLAIPIWLVLFIISFAVLNPLITRGLDWLEEKIHFTRFFY